MTEESGLDDRARRVTRVFHGRLPEDKETKVRFEIGDELFHLDWGNSTVKLTRGLLHYIADRTLVLRSTELKTPQAGL